jgi:glycosyltransferase involved in cell wall biosynthesis
MNILQVAPYFIPYLGGQERYIYQLSTRLVKQGNYVTVLTSNFPETTPHENLEGINVIRKNVLFKPLRNPISLGFFSLKKITSEYDVIHIHNEYSFPSMLTAYLKNNKKPPLVLTNHLGELNFEDPVKNGIGRLYLQSIGKGIWNHCDVIVVLSQSQKEFLTSINPKISSKIQIIPNAIDLESLKRYNSPREKEKSHSIDITENGPKLLYVGQLIKRKGLKWLLLAINILKNDFPHLKLILVGDGEDQEYFQEIVAQLQLNKYVDFLGRIDHLDKLVSLYQECHAFVLPSLSEGLPTVILEAFYFGLPLIATDIPGVREFAGYSTIVPPHDENKLAEAIKNLFMDDNIGEACQLALKARRLVENKYNWEVVSQEYQRIYQELL